MIRQLYIENNWKERNHQWSGIKVNICLGGDDGSEREKYEEIVGGGKERVVGMEKERES